MKVGVARPHTTMPQVTKPNLIILTSLRNPTILAYKRYATMDCRLYNGYNLLLAQLSANNLGMRLF